VKNYEWAFPPANYDRLDIGEKYDSIMDRMGLINRYLTQKEWRNKYATEDQFKEEYPDDHEKAMKLAFEVIKAQYLEHRDHWVSVKEDYIVILEKIIEQDAEQILLGNEDYGV